MDVIKNSWIRQSPASITNDTWGHTQYAKNTRTDKWVNAKAPDKNFNQSFARYDRLCMYREKDGNQQISNDESHRVALKYEVALKYKQNAIKKKNMKKVKKIQKLVENSTSLFFPTTNDDLWKTGVNKDYFIFNAWLFLLKATDICFWLWAFRTSTA